MRICCLPFMPLPITEWRANQIGGISSPQASAAHNPERFLSERERVGVIVVSCARGKPRMYVVSSAALQPWSLTLTFPTAGRQTSWPHHGHGRRLVLRWPHEFSIKDLLCLLILLLLVRVPFKSPCEASYNPR